MNKKVQNFLENLSEGDKGPLYFIYYKDGIKVDGLLPLSFNSIEELIMAVVEESYNRSSYREGEIFFCGKDRARSALDIWRLCLPYDPSLTLPKVMSAIYTLGMEKKLVGHFCSDVERRVFKSKRLYSCWGLMSTEKADEFRLYFHDWKDIDKEEE